VTEDTEREEAEITEGTDLTQTQRHGGLCLSEIVLIGELMLSGTREKVINPSHVDDARQIDSREPRLS
jgi:hypothetical protein